MNPEPFEYITELERAMLLFPLAAEINIEALENHLNHVETVAPILLPSEWMRGARNLDDQRKALQALGPFVRSARRLRDEVSQRTEPRR